MKKVELHTFDRTFVQNSVQWTNKEVPDFLNFLKTKHKNFDGLFDYMKTLSIGAYVLDRDKKKCALYLRYTMKGILAHFEQASYPGQQVQVEVCGENMTVTGKESTDYKLGPSYWIEGLFMAIILRDKDSIQKFLNIPPQVMMRAQMASEELFMIYSFFLKSLLGDGEKAGQLLIDAYKLTDPKNYSEERYVYIRNMVTPQLDLFISMLKDKTEEFNEYLQKALLKHKEEMGDSPKTVVSLISFELTGICVLAREYGIKIEVESEYIPHFLIEGNF